MHSDRMCSCCSVPWQPPLRMAWSPDRSRCAHSSTPFPVRSLQIRKYLRIRFQCGQLHCWSLPCRFRHHLLADIPEFLLPVHHRYREALRPLRSAFRHFLRQQELLAECHGVTSQSRMVLPAHRTYQALLHHNLLYYCRLGTFRMHPPRRVPFPQSVSNG